jgi:hypothetical protein
MKRVYNPEFPPGDNRGWKDVSVDEVQQWLDRGWVAELRESLDIRESVKAEIVQEMDEKPVKKRGRPRKVNDDNQNG